MAEQAADVVDPQRIHAVREGMNSNWPMRCMPDWVGVRTTRTMAAAYRPTRSVPAVVPERPGLSMLVLANDAVRQPNLARQGLQRFRMPTT